MSASMSMMKQEANLQNQGIVTILGPENRADTASSLRRTLSADMSSKKWLSQNEFSPMKKIASSDELSLSNPKIVSDSFSSSEEDENEAEAERGQDEIWDSIQRDKKAQQEKAAGQFDIWSSILSQKANDDGSKSLPPPYIHPLVKRSQSSLSEKSLEICTESLGSETGSDGFSSSPPSENGDSEEENKEDDKEQQQQQQQQQQPLYEAAVELIVPKYNSAAASKKSPPRSFPPPIPSLSRQDSSSLHMRPHRDNGRLVLQAVSVPSQNNFRSQRQDGRLVLTFADLFNNEESKEYAGEVSDEEEIGNMEDFEEEFGGFKENENDYESEEDEEVEEIESDESENREVETVMEEEAPVLSSGFQSVQGLAVMMNNKPVGLVNRNSKRSEKSNEAVNLEDVNVLKQQPTSVASQSLPPRPRMTRLIPSAPAMASAAAAAASLNDYEYCWRSSKPATTKAPSDVPNPFNTHHLQQNSSLKNNRNKFIVSEDIHQTSNEQQKLVVLRGKNGGYLVHKLNSCKESRRSFLFWERHCIAT